ncbi:aminotransferase class IV [Arcobacter sp. FWKO B]|uniref:aminotransferase class IV n=1 Tax=Arcobacter sp. FWKO B TaxID=2593672 RepID=UPI0018A6748E|nr:aminotransferase class IV [Arcobacter sp. FWKO B]QOG12828.1 branched-chain amino acid aminotransferase [Arcobacter sp. FWKO B]
MLNKNKVFFETIRYENQIPQNLSYHNDRLNKTRKEVLGIDSKIDLAQLLYTSSDTNIQKCKVIYSDDIINIELTPYKKREVKNLKIVEDNTIKYIYKSINRDEIDSLYSKRELNDDIIIVQNGLITDTSIANIALFIDNKWLTPKNPLLYGTTRQRYIDSNMIIPADIDINMLLSSQKIALLNAMIGFDILKNWEII